MMNLLLLKLSTEPMFLMMQTVTKSFTSQTHLLKRGTGTIQGTLNMKIMRIASNWLNTCGN